jgi:two-component system, OmpR family, response regulator QseB
MSHILLVEDEDRIASFVKKGLSAQGFQLAIAPQAKMAMDLALTGDFDLMILDLGLPDQDGLDLLDSLRGQGVSMPIIILTARDDIDDKVSGFEKGANDYLTKPFRFEELLVRIKARLRDRPRTSATSADDEAQILGQGAVIQLDLRSRQAWVEGRWVELATREFVLAELFFRNEGKVLSREQILNRVWGYDYDPGSNIVDVYVGYLRKKIGSECIETVRGQGYRLRQLSSS